MVAKIISYLFIIFIIAIEEKYLGLFHDIGRYFFPILLIAIYLLMLKLEMRKRSILGESYSDATKAGFIFSFGIGILWAGLMSLAAGFHYPLPKNVIDILWSFFNWLAIGCFFGFVGKKIGGVFYKQPNTESRRKRRQNNFHP
ncbi:MAG: hypothetical protein GY705_25995 [Bacteroidetes bacterium]|nr:hypothetical protein [Bacteroidota bacterium]